jgi:Zn-dependent peptidase ImmA (M78 family)
MDVQRKQDWYRDYLLERGAEPLPYIGKYDANSDPKQIASDITKTLGPEFSERKTPKRQDQFLNYLTEKAEDAGILVMRSGIVGNNTHRSLEVYEFRGFAICDDIAPVIFINGNDAKAAQTFTLIHELAHLWIGQSGISDISLENQINNKKQNTEKLCNTVAAEVLVPENKFSEKWKVTDSLEDNAFRLAEYFRVSNVVIARRAFDLGLIERSEYSKYYNNQKQLWQEKKNRN